MLILMIVVVDNYDDDDDDDDDVDDDCSKLNNMTNFFCTNISRLLYRINLHPTVTENVLEFSSLTYGSAPALWALCQKSKEIYDNMNNIWPLIVLIGYG